MDEDAILPGHGKVSELAPSMTSQVSLRR
jgi:hypothetical protein